MYIILDVDFIFSIIFFSYKLAKVKKTSLKISLKTQLFCMEKNKKQQSKSVKLI
jgi:hypothetical protein